MPFLTRCIGHEYAESYLWFNCRTMRREKSRLIENHLPQIIQPATMLHYAVSQSIDNPLPLIFLVKQSSVSRGGQNRSLYYCFLYNCNFSYSIYIFFSSHFCFCKNLQKCPGKKVIVKYCTNKPCMLSPPKRKRKLIKMKI